MNICYIANTAVPARMASSIHIMKMCQAYARLGHDVTLVLPDHAEWAESSCEDVYAFYGVQPDFAICKVPLSRWRLDFIYYSIVLPLKALNKRPVLVHSRSLTPAWGMTSLFRKATIFEIHDAPSQNPRQRQLFHRITGSRNLRALVTITQALANHVRPLLPDPARLVVAPDGVDETWLEEPPSPGAVRERLGLGGETRRLAVYTGHLYQGRGIELIIEVARRLPDHLFVIVGGRDADVMRYRREAGELSNLRFKGFRPPAEVLQYLQAADVLLMPYGQRVEVAGGGNTAAFASPMKMFEYMASGRPILASTLPVLREVLQDGVNALLLPYDEPERWVEALQRLRREPEFAAALGRRARADVRQYTWENRARFLLRQSGATN